MDIIGDATYDTVLCTEVLEHVPEPALALSEMRRVLRPDGVLLLSVPYLSRLHEEPHDYFRFTRHGLRHLLTGAGFRAQEIIAAGSLLSFLGHQTSTALVAGTWHLPMIRELTYALNAALITLPCFWLDRLLRLHELIPLNYVVVARPASTAALQRRHDP